MQKSVSFFRRRQIVLSMKFFILFVFITALQASANVHSQEITCSFKDVPLKKVFNSIKKQSNYVFFYSYGTLDKAQPVTIDIKKGSLEDILKACFKNQPLSYIIKDKTIVIKLKKPDAKPLGAPREPEEAILPQQTVIHGRITDSLGTPIAGASIQVVGTKRGVVTNERGYYELAASQGEQIKVSFVGYIAKIITIGQNLTIDVSLSLVADSMEDMVVVAYGQKQRKIETLGAQSSMNVEDLKQPVANLSTVLAGRVSGLVGVQRSGEPGRDGASLFIRGSITQGDNSPLVLVDGVERSFSNLDPDDIASLTILKDASATAVYGVRGANGVIIITTKKGTPGMTNIEFDYYQGMTDFTTLPKTANGVTYMQMANEASTTRGGQPIYSEDLIRHTYQQDDPYLYPNVNWMKEIFNDYGHNRKANLSFSGGSQKASYRVSAGYYDETGLFAVDGLQQYNSSIKYSKETFTSALTFRPTKTTTIDLGIKGWISNGNYPGTSTNNIFRQVLLTYPILYPKMYPDGKEPFLSTGGGLYSPYALLTNRGYNTTYESQVMSNIKVKQNLDFLTKGLSAYVLYSFDVDNSNSLSRLKTPTTYYATKRDSLGNLDYTSINFGSDYLSFSRGNGGDRQFYLEAALNYSNTFGKHKVTGLLLYNQSDQLSATAGDLINSIPHRSLGSVGRFTYSYNDRYLAEVAFGYNGAETFDPDHRYGFFPSYALGWVLSNEKFYGDFKNIFQLIKFRASYGLVGNSNIGGRRFAYVGTVGSTNGYQYAQDRNSNNISGIDINDYPVAATWETEKDLNLGLDLKTFNNALTLGVDAFYRRRENIFLNRGVLPSFLGLRSGILGNLGITSGKGIDITANFHTRLGQVDITAQGNFTYYENKWIEDDKPQQPYPWLDTKGKAVWTRWGYIAEGFYTQEEIDNPDVPKTIGGVVQAGDLKYKDLNGDGVIDANDKTVIGRDQLPQIQYGFGTSIGYKGFSLNAFFEGVGDVDFLFSNEFMPFRNGSAKGSLYDNITDRWTPENPRQDAFYPRLSYGADINQNYQPSTHWIFNGKFIRLKSLDFGYTFQKYQLSKLNIGLKKLRIYFIGYNLFTISPFKFWDPELGGGSGTVYPNIRTFSLGVNASF